MTTLDFKPGAEPAVLLTLDAGANVIDAEFVETPTGPNMPPQMPQPEPNTNRPEENPMTATTTATSNPHRIPTFITGWAAIATVIGGLYGASHDPKNASWSAFAIVAATGVYLFNKVRKTVHDRRAGRVAVAR